MTKADADHIVKLITPANTARLDGSLGDGTVYWRPTSDTAELAGNFTADELEAIAIHMRDNYEPR